MRKVIIERNERPAYRRGSSCDTVYRIQDVVWLIVGIIELILVLRFIFLAFGAALAPFTAFLYSISQPFVAPFSGIFGTVGSRIGFIDVSTLVAIVIYLTIGWLIEALTSIILSPRNVRC